MTFHAAQTVCGVLSTVLAVLCVAPYLRSIVNGRTRPHQWSWFIFTIMNGIVTISQFLEGGRTSVLISLTFSIASLVCFLLSLKYGTRETSRFDRFLFSVSLLTIVVWVLTKNNATAIWLTVVIDICATAMILLKVRQAPASEDPYPWLLGAIAYVFSCITLINTPAGILYVRPIYGLVTDAVIVLVIAFYLRRNRLVEVKVSAV